jgi:Phospholipase_D-nuclease N-terminal
MMHAMGRLYILLFGLEILLMVLALISCLSAEDGEVRALPRYVWVIVILLFPLVGSIVYFAVGRPLTTAPRSTWAAGGGFPEATRPRGVAPDDDPEFLSRIDRQQKREQEDLLRRWEDDLRRREEDLRKKEDLPPTDG